MSKSRQLVMGLVTCLAVATVSAEEIAPYSCDFNTTISTNDPAFKIASNWRHIAESHSYYGEDYWMEYDYYSTSGCDDSGYLYANSQFAESGDYYDDGTTVTDVLVTPAVKGTVKLSIKNRQYSSSYVEVYSINADGTLGTLLKKLTNSDYGNDGTWQETTLAEGLTEYQRLGLRCANVGIDNFSATSANIEPEKSIAFESVEPSATTGTLYWDQQPNGKVKITYKVKVTNDGEVDLVQGMEGYSITMYNASTKTNIVTVAVPQDLAMGATSEEFEVSAEVEPSEIWNSTYSSHKLNLRENLGGRTSERASSQYRPYESKFAFRNVGSTTTGSIYDDISFDIITETTSKSYEIYNDGNAPLTINSITVDGGFTVSGTESGAVVEAKQSSPVVITLPGDTPGSYSGNLTINYDKNGTAETYTLGFTGIVAAADAWTCDFGKDEGQFPAGSVANNGISIKYNYKNGAYDYCLEGDENNNEFILPLLHAEAGEILSFTTARNYYSGSTYNLEVFASKVRGEWGETPLLTLTDSDVTSRDFITNSVTIPEAGDWYIMFRIAHGQLDNLAGLKLVEKPYDIYIKEVNSPAEKQKGEEVSFDITTIATATLAATDYTVQFIGNDEVLYTAESVALEANAKTEKDFAVTFTPEVETTTLYKTKARFTFIDGTVIESPEQDMKITYQPDFVFFDKDTYAGSYNKPSNRTKPISFGTTNVTGVSQEFEIYNWGKAPLTVSSITVPEGFSVTPQEATVASKERQLVTISVSTETPGLYEGNLEIKYLDGDAAEQTFTLPISVNLLDTSKWYAEFGEGDTTTAEWPAGTIHGKNVNITNAGAWDAPEMSINSNSTSDNMVISPKLHAEAGDNLELCAKLYSDAINYQRGAVKIYTSATRDGLKSDETRTLIATLSGKDVEEAFLVTSEFNRFNVTMPEAGDFYLGFELTERLYVKYIYGLTDLKEEHDLSIVSSNIPTEAMQNVVKEMSVSVHNFGHTPEAAGAYTVEAYVAGEKVTETAGTVEIPVSYRYEDDATSVVIPVRYPKVGTFPVYLRVVAGERVLETEPVDVTFAEETFSAEKQIGAISSNSSSVPLNLYYNNSESIMIYTPEQLGLENGDKISSLHLKGFFTHNGITSDVKVYYAWSDASTIEKPAAGKYNVEGMIEALNTAGMSWQPVGKSDETQKMLSVDFTEPLVYESGKSLILLIGSYNASAYVNSSYYGWENSETEGQCFCHYNDSADTFASSSDWHDQTLPVLYLSLSKESVVISGTVTADDVAVEGAEVKLVSTDGDNVQYSALTDATGAYSLSVIQNSRNYDVTVMKDGKGEYLDDQLFEASGVYDFAIVDVVSVDNTALESHTASANAIVNLNLELQAGYNTLVLPFSLTTDEVAEVLGAGTELLVCNAAGISEDGATVTVYFGHEDAENGLVAGKPYIVNVTESPAPVRLRGKEVISEVNSVTTLDHIDFMGTYTPEPYDANMYIFNGMDFAAAVSGARSEEMVMPYGAYVYLKTPGVSMVHFVVDDNVQSGVSEIDASLLDGTEEVYNLQGIRVHNPGEGIYIVNGKKVLIKK